MTPLKFAHNLGLESSFEFVDVLSFDLDVMGAMVPEIYQTQAIILLYPLSDAGKREKPSVSDGKDVYFMKQNVENACGSVALLHVLGNNMATVSPGSLMDKFYSSTKEQSAEERGAALENDNQICKFHASFSSLGQTEAPDASIDVDLHFIALVKGNDGKLYELDGRLDGPVCHGDIDAESQGAFFMACSKIIQDRFIGDSNSVNFTAMALIPYPSYLS